MRSNPLNYTLNWDNLINFISSVTWEIIDEFDDVYNAVMDMEAERAKHAEEASASSGAELRDTTVSRLIRDNRSRE